MVELYVWIAIGTYLFTDYDFYRAELQTIKVKLIRAALWPLYLTILVGKALYEILLTLYGDTVLWFKKEDNKNVHRRPSQNGQSIEFDF